MDRARDLERTVICQARSIMSTRQDAPEVDTALKDTGIWVAVLTSLSKFDELEIQGVVNGLLKPMLPDECVQSIYYRASANVRTMLELKSPGHFRAIGMLSRSMYELAVDISIFSMVQGAPIKMRVFLDIEKLRASRTIVVFAQNNPLTLQRSVQPQQDYITNNESRILNLAKSAYPGMKLSDISHWSGLRLGDRIKMLSVDMQEQYANFYKQLSWSTHSGLEGSYGLKPETFVHMCGMGYHLAALNYETILREVIKAFKIDKADPLKENKMKLARYLPFTENEEMELALRSELAL